MGRVGGSSSSVEPIPEERISTHSSFSKEGGEPLLFITSWSLPAETVGNELKASTKYWLAMEFFSTMEWSMVFSMYHCVRWFLNFVRW